MRPWLCWSLIVFFAAGYVPSRVAACSCTAATNCGCSCWQDRAFASQDIQGDADDDGRSCCARTRSKACAAGDDSGSSSYHVSSQPIEGLLAPRPEAPAPNPAVALVAPAASPLVTRSLEPLVPPPQA